MTLLAVGVALLGSGWAVFVSVRVQRCISDVTSTKAQPHKCEVTRSDATALAGQIEELRALYGEIDGWRDDINIAVAEGIKNVERAENRVRATVRRAQAQLAEHGFESPGIEAEASELRTVDADRSGARGLRPVHEVLAESLDPPPGIPGNWTPEAVRYLKGV